MRDGPEIKTYSYTGPLTAACEGFVQEKRAVGCLYNTEAKKLSEFSRFTMQRWTMQGSDPTTLLPRLTAYLGHNDFSATEQYLRMTAETYPEVSRLMEEKYGYIIPSMEGSTDENH